MTAPNVVWLTPAEYAALFSLTYDQVVKECQRGMPDARKARNGFHWRIAVDREVYEVLRREAA